jgi:hypothetical protein
MEENLKPITAQEFYAKNKVRKDVQLKSGLVFQIRKINVRDYGVDLPIQTINDISGKNDERKAIQFDKMTVEQRKSMMAMNDRIICTAVEIPKLTTIEAQDCILLSDLSDDDYYELLNEVMTFSKGGQELKSFRTEQESVPSV